MRGTQFCVDNYYLMGGIDHNNVGYNYKEVGTCMPCQMRGTHFCWRVSNYYMRGTFIGSVYFHLGMIVIFGEGVL